MKQGQMPDPASMTNGPGRASGGHVATLSSRSEGLDLAAWLQSPHRTQPAVVLTATGPDRHVVDTAALAAEFADRVEVYVLAGHRPATDALNELAPSSWRLFGDAVRVFPSGGRDPDGYTTAAAASGPEAAVRRQLAALLAQTQPGSGSPAPKSGSTLWPATATPHRIRDAAEARRLAAHLRDPDRALPIVVISVHPDAAEPYVDPSDVVEEVKGLVPVVVVDAGATYGITDELGDRRLSVFYGAGRVYPTGTAWLADRYAAPLHMCASKARGPRVAADLVADALNAANTAGLLTASVASADRTKSVEVRVDGFSSDHHVLVRTHDRRQAFLQVARLRVDVPPERLVQRKQRLRGTLIGQGLLPEFVPDPAASDVEALVRRRCPDGVTMPAKVAQVTPDGAQVLLHPDFAADLPTEDGDLTQLMSPGDVIAVEVAWVEDSCVVALGEEAKAFEALPVLPGGPPWLLLGEAERPGQGADEPPQPEQTSSPPTDGPGQPTETALRELQDARAAAELYAERVAQLEARLAEQQREAKALKAALRKATAERRNRTLPEVFADDEEQFRWEVDFAYLVRVDEVQRAEYPLADFVVGPAFLNRMDSLQGISRDKILDVVVDVLSDRAKDIATREVHKWLEHRAGGQEVRHDGARAWRASLQVRSNSARRLKYWRLPDGRIELDSVGVHDDGIR